MPLDTPSTAAGADNPTAEATGPETGIEFELDLEAPAEAPASGTEFQPVAAPASRTPLPPTATPDPIDDLRTRLAAAERQNIELRTRVEPLLQRPTGPAQPSPLTPQQLATGDYTPEQFAQWLAWRDQQLVAQMQSQMGFTARQMSSEQTLRGRFSPEAMGAGFDYDSMVANYLRPAYEQNPYLRELATRLIPESPAEGEYWAGLMMWAYEQSKQDPVKMVRTLVHAFTQPTREANDLDQRITQAQRTQAQRVAAGAQGTVARKRKIGPKDIEQMSDDEFAAVWQQQERPRA